MKTKSGLSLNENRKNVIVGVPTINFTFGDKLFWLKFTQNVSENCLNSRNKRSQNESNVCHHYETECVHKGKTN